MASPFAASRRRRAQVSDPIADQVDMELKNAAALAEDNARVVESDRRRAMAARLAELNAELKARDKAEANTVRGPGGQVLRPESTAAKRVLTDDNTGEQFVQTSTGELEPAAKNAPLFRRNGRLVRERAGMRPVDAGVDPVTRDRQAVEENLRLADESAQIAQTALDQQESQAELAAQESGLDANLARTRAAAARKANEYKVGALPEEESALTAEERANDARKAAIDTKRQTMGGKAQYGAFENFVKRRKAAISQIDVSDGRLPDDYLKQYGATRIADQNTPDGWKERLGGKKAEAGAGEAVPGSAQVVTPAENQAQLELSEFEAYGQEIASLYDADDQTLQAKLQDLDGQIEQGNAFLNQGSADVQSRAAQARTAFDALLLENQQAVQANPDAQHLTVTVGDRKELWNPELYRRREKLLADAKKMDGDLQAMQGELEAESGRLQKVVDMRNTAASVLNDRVTKAKAVQASTVKAEADKLRATPHLAEYADDLEQIDRDVETRLAKVREMFPEGGEGARKAVMEEARVSRELLAKNIQDTDRAHQKKVGGAYAKVRESLPGVNFNFYGRDSQDKEKAFSEYKEGGKALDEQVDTAIWKAAQDSGVPEAEVRKAFEREREYDWTGSPESETSRVLSTGKIAVKPELALDKKAYERAIADSDATPEQKADAYRTMQADRLKVAGAVAPLLAADEESASEKVAKFFGALPLGPVAAALVAVDRGFTAWQKDHPSDKPQDEQILEYFDTQGKGAAFARHMGEAIKGSLTSLSKSAAGAGAAVTDANWLHGLMRDASQVEQMQGEYRQRTAVDANMPKALGFTPGEAYSTLLQSAPAIVGGSLNPAVAAILAGAQSGGGTYADAYEAYKTQGLEESEARRAARLPAMLTGAATAFLTAAGGSTGAESLSRVLQNTAQRNALHATLRGRVGAILKETGMGSLKGAVKEALLEEVPDQMIQGLVAKMSYQPGLTTEQYFEDAAKAAVGGFFMGGPFEALSTGAESSRRNRLAEQPAASSLEPEQWAEALESINTFQAPGLDPADVERSQRAAEALLYIGRGQAADLPDAMLETVGVQRNAKGELENIKGRKFPQVKIENGNPIITDQSTNWLKQYMPGVASTLSMDEMGARQMFNQPEMKPETEATSKSAESAQPIPVQPVPADISGDNAGNETAAEPVWSFTDPVGTTHILPKSAASSPVEAAQQFTATTGIEVQPAQVVRPVLTATPEDARTATTSAKLRTAFRALADDAKAKGQKPAVAGAIKLAGSLTEKYARQYGSVFTGIRVSEDVPAAAAYQGGVLHINPTIMSGLVKANIRNAEAVVRSVIREEVVHHLIGQTVTVDQLGKLWTDLPPALRTASRNAYEAATISKLRRDLARDPVQAEIDQAIAGLDGDDDANRGEEFLRQLLQKEIWNEVTELARLRPSLAEQIQNVLLQLAEALNNVLDKITNPQARKEVESYRDAAIDLAEQLGVVARGEVPKVAKETKTSLPAQSAPVSLSSPSSEAAKSNINPAAPAETPPLESVPIELGTVDEAAHEAAASPNNNLPAPTPAQIEAENYKVGPVVISGVKISVENPEGSKRRPEWPALKDHYGRIPGTMAQDGELIDVFVVPGTPLDYTGPVFVVQQIDPKTGENDEVKAIIGAKNAQDARETYERNYAPNWKGFGGFEWKGEMAGLKQFLAEHTSDNRISRENAANEKQSTPVPQPAAQVQTVGTPTPNGARAEIVWDVIDAADAAATIEDRIGENQNRQRAGDQASDKQRVQLATNPDVTLLGEFPTGMSGAPMVDDASGKTVAGNGRMGGILLGYSSPDTGFATVYKPFVLSEAEKRGLGDKARGMKQPVLVRRITRYENGSKEDFVAQNNPKGGGILRETKTGEGLADAKSLAAILPELTLTAGGALTTDALYAVAQKLAQDNRPLNEDTQGKPDAKEALQRVQQATLAVMAQRAGRTIDEIVSIMESESGKRVVSQIMRAAPDLSRLDTDLSLVTPIMDALLVYKDGLSAVSNEAYDNLDDWAQNRGSELLSGNQSEESLLLLDLFVRANRKPSILRDWFDTYLLLAGDEQYERNEASQTADIFGDQRREVPAGTLAQRAQASQPAGADEGSAGGDVADQRRVAAPADPGSMSEDEVFNYRLESAKREINEDIASGTIPATVAEFSRLHDYVDGNEYVNDADRPDRLIGPLGKRLKWENDDYIDFTSRLIVALDEWLKAGRPTRNATAELDENTGLPLNPDGTVTVYHGTTKAAGDSIRASGVIKSAGEPDVYFTTEPTASTGYGDGTVVAVDINPDKLVLDDEFPDGRRDFRVPVGKSKSLAVKVRNAPADPDFSLETQTPDDVQAEREAEEERQRVLAREAQAQRLRKIVEDRIRAAEADRKQGRLVLEPDLPIDLFDYGQRLQRQKFQPPLLSVPPVRRAPADPGNGPTRSRQMFEAWYKAGGGDLNDRITTEKAWRENRMRFVRKAAAATVASSIRTAQREDIQDEGPPETEWPVLAKDDAPRLPDGMAKKLGTFWTDISSDPKAFAYPTSNATDIQTLAKVMSGGKVTAKEVENRIELKHRDGGELVIKDINGRPDIGAGAANSAGKKDGGGKLMYQIALSWAANNGKRINPSYALSPINAFTRRTSAMLSSALRYGTTRHMQVDPDQGVLGWRDWRGDQDTSGNIGRLAYREMTQTLRAYPQLSEFRYDFEAGRFERNGQPATPADIEAAIKQTDPAGFANAAGVGQTTAQRAIITQTAMNEGMVADDSMTAPERTLYASADPGEAKRWALSLPNADPMDRMPNETESPYKGDFVEGKLTADHYGDDPYIYENRLIDPREFADNVKLEGLTYNQVVNLPTTQKYIEWYRNGNMPPPITVVFNGPSSRLQSTNRRRVVAALEAGVDRIPAQVEIGRASEVYASRPERTLYAPVDPEQDAEYMKAVEAGDMAKAQKMVDEVARAAGYTTGPVIHGTKKDFTEFKEPDKPKRDEMFSFGFHFTDAPELSNKYGPNQITAHIKLENPLDVEQVVTKGDGLGLWLQKIAPKTTWFPNQGKQQVYLKNALDALPPAKVKQALKDAGYDGLIYTARFEERGIGSRRLLAEGKTYIVLDPRQIKSSEPITRDAQGNVIPLSQRFNPSASDLRNAPADPGDLNDDEVDIEALLASLESELPSDAEIERLTGMSLDEHKGWRTVGNPEPAGLGEDEDTRRRTDVVRLMYDLQREKESFAQWDEAADKMLAEDRNGVKLRLLEAAEEGAPLGSPEMVRAASKLIPQLMQEAVMTRNPRTMREAKLLTWSYARAGTEAARELAARQDRYKTPTERRAEFMTKLMFDINPKDRQNVEAAITPAEKRRRLRRIQAELDKARADRDVAREKAAEAEKRATQATKDQAQVLDEATTLRLRKIEAALQKEGITLEDVFDGRAQVRLNFARIAASALGGGSARKEKAVDLIIHGWPTTEIARATGYTAKQVDDIQKELSVNNGALRAVLAARVKSGFRVTDFVRPAANARKAPGDPGQPELTQAEIDAEVDRIIKLMVPTTKQRNSGKWKPQIRGDKLTGTAAATQADAQKQAAKIGRPGKPVVDGPFVPETPANVQGELDEFGRERIDNPKPSKSRQPAAIIPAEPGKGRQQNLGVPRQDLPVSDKDLGPNAKVQGTLDEFGRARIDNPVPSKSRQPTGLVPDGPNATKQGKLKLDPDTVEFMPRLRDDPAQDYRIARIISTVDATGLDMLQEYWINGILSGPQTHVVNTLGNLLSGGWEYTGQRGMEMLTNLFMRDPASAQVGEIPQLLKGLRRGMGEAWSMAAKAWDAEADVATDAYLNEQAEFTGDSWDKSRRIKAAIGGKTGRVIRMPGRALMAMDSFFKTIFANMEVGAQAYRIGRARGLEGEQLQTFIENEIKATGSASWIRAMEKAKEATFQGDINTRDKGGSYADHAASEFMRATNSVRLLKFLFPFVKTPYNIFKTGLRKSPLGAANVLYQLARAGFYKMKDGKPVWDSYPKAAAVKHFSEQTIAFMALASMFGMMEGDEDDDKKMILITGGRGGGRMDSGARDLQKRTQGGPYQIRIGGKWFPYGRLEPIATTLGTMTDAVRAVKSGRNAPQVGAAMFSNLIGQAQDKTFLQGFSRLSDTLMSLSDEDAGEKVLENARQTLMEMVVPNLIRQPLRNLDENVRNYKAADVPYAAIPSGEFAEPAIDEYGRELIKDGGLSRLIYPAPLKTEDVHPADKLLERWNQANPDEKYEPLRSNKATYSITTKNPETGRVTKVEMEPEQKTAMDVTRGMLRDEMLRGSGLLTPENIKRPTLEVIDRIKDIREKANRTAGKIIRQPNWREEFARFRAERQNQPKP